MKKLLCLCLAGLMCLGGCAGQTPETTPTEPETEPTVPEVTESPEEAAVFKILMIGQSLAQDTVLQLYDVLKAEMPDREFLVADIYASITLADHRANILQNLAAYKYIVFADGKKTTTDDYTITRALRDHSWDLVIFNDATYPSTQAEQYVDGDHQFMINHIRENTEPWCKLAYNATWANPTSALVYGADRRQPPETFRSHYMQRFGGSRNLYYRMICQNIEKYIETDKQYDMVFHPGTAIQYASETHGVPEAEPNQSYELYRDYVHLSDFGRLIAAYQLYAQLFGLEELTAVHVDKILAERRATAIQQALGDLVITEKHKEAIIASVNFALKNPNQEPEQTARAEAILEPLP